MLEPGPGEEIGKVGFTDYKGIEFGFGAPDITRSVLKIAAQGNGKWQIWAEAPGDLSLVHEDISEGLKKDLETLRKLAHLQFLANLPKELRILPTKEVEEVLETEKGKEKEPPVETQNTEKEKEKELPAEMQTEESAAEKGDLQHIAEELAKLELEIGEKKVV